MPVTKRRSGPIAVATEAAPSKKRPRNLPARRTRTSQASSLQDVVGLQDATSTPSGSRQENRTAEADAIDHTQPAPVEEASESTQRAIEPLQRRIDRIENSVAGLTARRLGHDGVQANAVSDTDSKSNIDTDEEPATEEGDSNIVEDAVRVLARFLMEQLKKTFQDTFIGIMHYHTRRLEDLDNGTYDSPGVREVEDRILPEIHRYAIAQREYLPQIRALAVLPAGDIHAVELYIKLATLCTTQNDVSHPHDFEFIHETYREVDRAALALLRSCAPTCGPWTMANVLLDMISVAKQSKQMSKPLHTDFPFFLRAQYFALHQATFFGKTVEFLKRFDEGAAACPSP